MPSYTGGLTTDARKLSKFIEDAAGTELAVGFLGGKTYEDGTPVGEVARQNEFGVISKNQPPRPFMRPAVETTIKVAPALVADLSSVAITGSMSMDDVFTNLGLMAQQEVVKAIESVHTPALAPLTIALRKERGNTSIKPLEDTLTMKNSVDFEVSK